MKNRILAFVICVIQANISYGANTEENHSSFSIEKSTISSIQTAIKNHQITCEQLINAYLDRIKRYDLSIGNNPPINAITEINPSVINQARLLDKIFLDTNSLKPLHCVPILLKDNIDSYDSTTTSGSFSLLGNQPIQDAFLVSKLRKAGAIILGHGSMDEFAFGMYGISSRNGRTGNAFDAFKNPGGSSAGEAVAVSANFVVVGIGTDNSGSVRIPAAFNGVIGLRPSTGLISQKGIFPMGNLDGVAGPLTRNVEDLAKVLDVIAQKDSQDKKTFDVPRVKDYVSFLQKNGLSQKHIGIVRQVGEIDIFKDMPKDIQQVMQESFNKMRSLGAIVVDNINFPEFDNNRKFNMSGMIQDINKYLISFPSTRKNFQDICQSDRTRTFGDSQECIKFMKSIPNHSSKQYIQALAIFEKNRKYIEKIMKKYNLDALFIPISTVGIATSDPLRINSWQASVSSNSGLPSIVMNIGYSQNMPIGIELVGAQFNEGTLIEIAYSYEQNFPSMEIPKMPEPNNLLLNFSIPEMNNLITLLGRESYERVLKNGKSGELAREDLTPEIFKSIVHDKFKKLSFENENFN